MGSPSGSPKDLLKHFDGRPTIRHSLGTRDLREANEKARLLHAELTSQFAALRRSDNPQKVELTEGLIRAIAGELRRWVLVADDNARDLPGFTQSLLIRHARRMDADATPELKAVGQAVRQSLLSKRKIYLPGGAQVPEDLERLTSGRHR